jgi:hypothetical protein
VIAAVGNGCAVGIGVLVVAASVTLLLAATAGVVFLALHGC